MTKHIASLLFVVYFLLLPVWLYYGAWYHLVVGYVCYWFMLDVIQSAFMHRWAAHGLWSPPRWLQKILATIGVVALLGTPITYAAWHRTHHAYADTEKDPHSPVLKGWLYVVFAHYHSAQIKRAVDRMRDPYFLWLNKNMLSIMLIGNAVLFVSLPFVWFMTLWAVPVAYTIFNTNFLVLVLSHRTGTPQNLPTWLWPVLFDDGTYHKSHHDVPQLSQSKYDPAGWVINKMKWNNEIRTS